MNEVKSPKKPLLYYYVVALLVVMLFNFIAMPWMAEHQIKEVDYNTFVTMTEQGEVGKVEIQQQDNRILFTSADEKNGLQDGGGAGRRPCAASSRRRRFHHGRGDRADVYARQYSCVGVAHHHLCCAGTVHVPQDDGEDGRRQLHDVQHGKVQRQGVCQICRRHSLQRRGRRGRGQGEPHRSRQLPARPQQVSGDRRVDAQGHPARRPSGNR